MAYASDDDVLAAAMAHAMAHALFNKRNESPIENERRADRVGIETASLAGFDVRKTIDYWEDLARAYPYLINPDPGHRSVKRSRTWSGRRGSPARGHHGHYEIAKRFRDIRAFVKLYRPRPR